jgi:hypothetical protein
LLFAFRRPFFLMLVHKKEGKEQDTLASAYFLRCSSTWAANETRPNGLQTTQAAAELEQTLAEPPTLTALLGASDRGP